MIGNEHGSFDLLVRAAFRQKQMSQMLRQGGCEINHKSGMKVINFISIDMPQCHQP